MSNFPFEIETSSVICEELHQSYFEVARCFRIEDNRMLFRLTEEREEPSEGLLYRHQESHLCQQMKLATVSQGQEPAAGWFQEETATCSTTQPCPGQNNRMRVCFKMHPNKLSLQFRNVGISSNILLISLSQTSSSTPAMSSQSFQTPAESAPESPPLCQSFSSPPLLPSSHQKSQ